MRQEVVHRYVATISDILPGSRFVLFGTTGTRFALPLSDIDLNLDIPVTSRDEELAVLDALMHELLKRDFVSKGAVTLARRQFLRVTDSKSSLFVDLTIGDGLVEQKTAELMKRWEKKYIGLTQLYIITKYMLMMRGLAGNAHEGGIGSFPLLSWIVAWLKSTWLPSTGEMPMGPFRESPWSDVLAKQLIPPPSKDEAKSKLYTVNSSNHNTGTAFLSLLEFIATFDTRKYAIDPLSPEIIVSKDEIPPVLNIPAQPYGLVIMPHHRELRDPDSPHFVNIAKSCSAILSIQYNVRSLLDKLKFRMGQYERGERPEILGSLLNADWRPYQNFREVNRLRWLRYTKSDDFKTTEQYEELLGKKNVWKSAEFDIKRDSKEKSRPKEQTAKTAAPVEDSKKSFEEKWAEVSKALAEDTQVDDSAIQKGNTSTAAAESSYARLVVSPSALEISLPQLTEVESLDGSERLWQNINISVLSGSSSPPDDALRPREDEATAVQNSQQVKHPSDRS